MEGVQQLGIVGMHRTQPRLPRAQRRIERSAEQRLRAGAGVQLGWVSAVLGDLADVEVLADGRERPLGLLQPGDGRPPRQGGRRVRQQRHRLAEPLLLRRLAAAGLADEVALEALGARQRAAPPTRRCAARSRARTGPGATDRR